MAKKITDRPAPNKHAGTAHATARFSGKHTFINPYLSDADKAYLSDNADTADGGVLELLELIGTEYALRVGSDERSGRFNAMLTCLAVDNANTGLILSVRGATPIDALYALYYLHVIKSEGLWRSITPEATTPSRWG